MSRNDYYGQSSQFRGLPYTGLRLAIELMAEESSHPSGALIFKRTGHLDRKGKVGLRTRLEPSNGLLDYLAQSGLVFPGHPKGFTAWQRRLKALIIKSSILWIAVYLQMNEY